MENTSLHTDSTKCIHCHRCRESCTMLSSYGIDIGDTARLRELAYHCFLCGNCSRICPAGIDGREIVMDHRRAHVSENSGCYPDRSFRMLLWEKKDYRFRNYRHAAGRSLLFPGCNFPSMYPKTTSALAKMLSEKAGIGIAYDCCGKPVAELGLAADEKRITDGISERLRQNGTEEVIMVCPNCYYYLKDRLDVRVVTVYEKLSELGIGSRVPGGEKLFMPCPDRSSGEMLAQIESLFADRAYERIGDAQCCGLGGSAAAAEPELADSMAERTAKEGTVRVYCASCAGKLSRAGADPRHILTEILETYEQPDTGKSALNRVLTKFK